MGRYWQLQQTPAKVISGRGGLLGISGAIGEYSGWGFRFERDGNRDQTSDRGDKTRVDHGSIIALITLIMTVVVTASAGIRYLVEISLKIQHFSLITQQGLEKLGVQMAMTDNEIKRETEELKIKIRFLEDKIRSQESDLVYVKRIIEQFLPGKFNRKTDFPEFEEPWHKEP